MLLPNELYERQLTPNSHLFIKRWKGKWVAWRETFGNGKAVKDEDGNVLRVVRVSSSVRNITTTANSLEEAIRQVERVYNRGS